MREPILALEGALDSFSVALLRDGEIGVAELRGQAALEEGLALVKSCLARARLELAALGGIAVGIGPGSFTGLRIAIAYAKSLALGANLPLVGVSSFDILDAGADAASRLPRLTVVYGRPGIACIRRSDSDGTRVACGPVAEATTRLTNPGEPITIVGATKDVLGAALERAASVQSLPPGSELAAATLSRIARMRPSAASIHEIAPDYGELPAARTR